jgi:hypothetical protein
MSEKADIEIIYTPWHEDREVAEDEQTAMLIRALKINGVEVPAVHAVVRMGNGRYIQDFATVRITLAASSVRFTPRD